MSDLVRVKIKGTVVTSRYGTLTSGDILRTDAAYAAHLVNECSAAVYVDAAPDPVDPPAVAEKPQKATKGK